MIAAQTLAFPTDGGPGEATTKKADTSAPASLPMQAYPSSLIVVYVPEENPTSTVMARTWANGACAGRRLCPPGQCGVTATGMCVVTAEGKIIPRNLAALHAVVLPGKLLPGQGVEGPPDLM